MPGVNFDDPYPSFLGFIANKVIQLGKAPIVEAAVRLTFLSCASAKLGSLTNIGEVLKDDGTAREGVLHDAFGEDVITVSRNLFQVFQLLEKNKPFWFRQMDVSIDDQLCLLSFDNQVRSYLPTESHDTSIARQFPQPSCTPVRAFSVLFTHFAFAWETAFKPLSKCRTGCKDMNISGIDRLMTLIVETSVKANTTVSIDNTSKVRLFCFAQMSNDGLLCLKSCLIIPFVFLDTKLVRSLYQSIDIPVREQSSKFGFGCSWIGITKQLIFFGSVVRLRTHHLSPLRYIIVSYHDNYISKEAVMQEVSCNATLETGETSGIRGIVLRVKSWDAIVFSRFCPYNMYTIYVKLLQKRKEGGFLSSAFSGRILAARFLWKKTMAQ